jgi:hypothetical protein
LDGVGPSLHDVFGRKAGGLDDYRYSLAMKRSGITWTSQTLETFVRDPQKAVPNNRMPFAGMPDAADRGDLIAHLEEGIEIAHRSAIALIRSPAFIPVPAIRTQGRTRTPTDSAAWRSRVRVGRLP